MIDRKAKIICFGEQTLRAGFNFGNPFAIPTNQKLRGRFMTRMRTGDECIPAFDSMDQTFSHEELQRTVYDRRRNALRAVCTVKPGENVVGAHWLMAGQHDFEYLPTTRRQAQIACRTQLAGLGQ